MTKKRTKSELLGARTRMRELFMQMLFEMEVQKDYSPEKKQSYMQSYMTDVKDKKQLAFFNELFHVVCGNLEEIDECISTRSENWTTQRMAKVDLAILRIATGEILYIESMPDSVSANEAVSIAKKYGSDDSRKFVNGILGEIIRTKDDIQAASSQQNLADTKSEVNLSEAESDAEASHENE